MFAECGTVKGVRVLKDKETGKPRGSYCYRGNKIDFVKFYRNLFYFLIAIVYNYKTQNSI